MVKYMGGFNASQTFSRLYLVPGAGHNLAAGAGYLDVAPDLLGDLMNWVENGQAPGSLTMAITPDPRPAARDADDGPRRLDK